MGGFSLHERVWRCETQRQLVALLLLVGSDSPCDGFTGDTDASDGPLSVETSDSVEKKGDIKTS